MPHNKLIVSLIQQQKPLTPLDFLVYLSFVIVTHFLIPNFHFFFTLVLPKKKDIFFSNWRTFGGQIVYLVDLEYKT